MDLKLPITLVDELADDEVRARGELDMASGEIRHVEYEDYDVDTEGVPAARKDYEFTVGMLASGNREVNSRSMSMPCRAAIRSRPASCWNSRAAPPSSSRSGRASSLQTQCSTAGSG